MFAWILPLLRDGAGNSVCAHRLTSDEWACQSRVTGRVFFLTNYGRAHEENRCGSTQGSSDGGKFWSRRAVWTTADDSQNCLIVHAGLTHTQSYHTGLYKSAWTSTLCGRSPTEVSANTDLILCVPTQKIQSSTTAENISFIPNSCRAVLPRPKPRLYWMRERAQVTKHRKC